MNINELKKLSIFGQSLPQRSRAGTSIEKARRLKDFGPVTCFEMLVKAEGRTPGVRQRRVKSLRQDLIVINGE